MLNNWSVLAKKNHQLRPARLADGLDKAASWDADVILATELGTTAKTLHLQDCQYESDWSTFTRPRPGKGVGCFFHARWQEHWIHIPVKEAPDQCRFYLLSAPADRILLCVFYAPHQNYTVPIRLAFYIALRTAVGCVMARFPNTALALAGDANMPELRFDEEGFRPPEHTITQYFHDNFLTWLECANTSFGVPAATQRSGATLDLLLFSPGLSLVSFITDPTRVTGCDHHALCAKFKWKCGSQEAGLTWVPNRNYTQAEFDEAMTDKWPALYGWYHHTFVSSDGSPRQLESIIDAVVILLGVLVLGALWQAGSRFGRFAQRRHGHVRSPWWNQACSNALAKMRAARGTRNQKLRRGNLSMVIKKSKVRHWRAFVSRCERKGLNGLQCNHKLHKVVKSGIRPQLRAAHAIKIGDRVLKEEDTAQIWPAFLEAQVSWDGPVAANDLLEPDKKVTQTEAEFDDAGAKAAAKTVREWQSAAISKDMFSLANDCFSFPEVCEAQAGLNEAATASPFDKLPMQAVLSQDEAARACIMGILNLVYVCRYLPWLWRLVPVLPLRKPNKPKGELDSHRPISLLAALFKLLDKLLFCRIWPAIAAAVTPWQGGGILGADMMAWTVSEILTMRRNMSLPTYAGFVDGQSAYCRPPAHCVMEALLLVRGLCSSDLLITYAILVGLWGTACILGGRHGLWKVHTGLVQGGALSTALFVVLLLPLAEELKRIGCGIWLRHGPRSLHLPLLAYIDDLLLFTDCPRDLQKALTAVYKWACKIRMRLNIGLDKSAVMVICRHAVATIRWHLGKRRLPVVDQYKYMGIQLASNCSHQALVGQISGKFAARTCELVRWAQVHHITLDLLARLWAVYIQVSALWGAALCHPTATQLQELLLAQRKAGRLLLGHSRRSPVPTTCVELGWPLIGTWLQESRLRLLARLLACTNSIVLAVAATSLDTAQGWMAIEVAHARNLAPDGLPCEPAAWHAIIAAARNIDTEADTARLSMLCDVHPQLASYRPAVLTQERRLGLNRMLHDTAISADDAKIISRLLCGGQGLRGLDPKRATPVTSRTACLACLVAGRREKETLQHFLFECVATEHIRCEAAVAACWMDNEAIALLHRDIWTFSQMRIIRYALLAMWKARSRLLSERGLNKRTGFEERVADLWCAAI